MSAILKWCPTDERTELLQRYLDAGWALVPIPRGEKNPGHKGWNLRENAITDVADLGRLTGMNVGLLHGYCHPTPSCALDIDHLDLARAMLAERDINLDALLSHPDALRISSGKAGSAKVLYRLPAGVGALTTVQFQAADKQMAFELRCAYGTGNTAQDILPPSIHTSGRPYVWANPNNTDPARMQTIPAPLLALWQARLGQGKSSGRPQHRKRKERPILVLQGMAPAEHRQPELTPEEIAIHRSLAGKVPPADTPQERARLMSMLSAVSADCSYETWRNIVWSILSTGSSDAAAIAYRWSRSAPDRFTEEGFVAVVNSFQWDYIGGISYGTLCHEAKEAGWHE